MVQGLKKSQETLCSSITRINLSCLLCYPSRKKNIYNLSLVCLGWELFWYRRVQGSSSLLRRSENKTPIERIAWLKSRRYRLLFHASSNRKLWPDVIFIWADSFLIFSHRRRREVAFRIMNVENVTHYSMYCILSFNERAIFVIPSPHDQIT